MKKILLYLGAAMLFFTFFFTVQSVQATTACAPHAFTRCVSNISYWYNSCGILEEVSKNCNTAGQVCQGGKCVEPASIPAANQVPTASSTPSVTLPPRQEPIQASGMSISMFAVKENSDDAWQKSVSVTNGDKIDFLIIVKNTSSESIHNVMVNVDTIDTIISIDNVKLNGAALSQNIVTGINLNTIDPQNSHTVTFSATVLPSNTQNILQLATHVNSDDVIFDSDYASININLGASSAAASPTQTTSMAQTETASKTGLGTSILSNLRRNWYVWLGILVLLTIVFIAIFKKLSSDN